MAAQHEDLNLIPEEKHYREYMTNGDDFVKIEIFRSAEASYRRALAVKPGDAEAQRKLDETKAKIRKENKAIYVIIAVLALVAVLVWAMA